MGRTYTAPDGSTYPLYEATADATFRVYKSDKRKAVIGDPHLCQLALGIRRDRNVEDVFVGSGKDAYIAFAKGKQHKGKFALHYTVPAAAARARDLFDTKNAPRTQIITLRAPTKGRTLEARSRLNKNRRAAIKAGAPIKKRPHGRRGRITRLGVPHRPRAHISNGVVAA